MALVITVSFSHAMAQTNFGDIKVGDTLNGKGVSLGDFVKPVPLPQGEWIVVARNDQMQAVGGPVDISQSSTMDVSLTLKSTDVNNNIVAIVLDFLPNSRDLIYNNGKCETGSYTIWNTFETTTSTLTFACATGHLYGNGFKKFIHDAASGSDEWNKNRFGPLTPFLIDIPDTMGWVRFAGNRSRGGRRVGYLVFFKTAQSREKATVFESAIKSWVQSTGGAMVDYLEGRNSTMVAFPAVEALPPQPLQN